MAPAKPLFVATKLLFSLEEKGLIRNLSFERRRNFASFDTHTNRRQQQLVLRARVCVFFRFAKIKRLVDNSSCLL